MHIAKNIIWVDEMRRGAGHGVRLKMAELRHAFTSAILLSLIWQLIVECESAAPNCSPSELPILVEPTLAGSLEDTLRGLDYAPRQLHRPVVRTCSQGCTSSPPAWR